MNRKTSAKAKNYVDIEFLLIDMITECGYRENKSWGDDEEEQLKVIHKFTNKIINHKLAEDEQGKG